MQDERIAYTCICCSHEKLNKSAAVLMPFVADRVFGHKPLEIKPEWGMRDLKSGFAYTLCNSLQCQHCGALFLDVRFSDREMEALYHDYRGPDYTSLRQFYEPSYSSYSNAYRQRAEYIDNVEAFLRPLVPANPIILDWGGDSGINTPLSDSAKEIHIYDISETPLINGAQRFDPATADSHYFDLITCSQVLEHVPHPKRVIQKIVEWMQPETLLYLEVPHEALMRENPGSLSTHLLKHHWHEHINFFTTDSLRELVEQAGLHLLEIREIEISLGWREGCIFSALCRRKL
jgi:SAM-dependent methyltransferase